jgi:sarcosine oxidase, subunit beta
VCVKSERACGRGLDTAYFITKLDAVQHTERDVVIGAGITGLAIALQLAERGSPALVIDRAGVGAGATGVQPGGVRQQFSTRVNCVLGRESLQVYRDLAEHLGVPVAASFEACGYIFLAHSPAQLEQLRATVTLQNELGIPSRIVGASEAAELVPGLSVETVLVGAYCAEDGYFDEPREVVEAFAAAARARGVRFEIVEARAIEQDGAGFRILLADGSIGSERVIVAAGVDTPTLLPELGLPIEPVAKHLFYSDPLPDGVLRPLVVSAERAFAAKQLADGRLLASDLVATGDPSSARAGWLEHVHDAIDDLLPGLSGIELPTIVSGSYDATPDSQPIVGAVGPAEGLFVAAGFSGHGFMLAPAIGRRLADLVLGQHLDPDLASFTLSRFSGERPPGELQTV